MSYNAILFDLDGTLLDTLEDLANSMNRVLTAQGFPTHPLDAYRYFVGNGARMLITRTLPENQRQEKMIQQCLTLFMEDYGRSWNRQTRPYDGVPEMLDTLAQKGQSPDAMFIGCSDSRVVSELLTGARPGALFVARVVANIVPPYGTGQNAVGAAVEYAVLHLKVKDLIICRHTDCGGVKALDQPVDMAAEPAIASWIEFARPAQSQIDARGLRGDARHQAIVEENVLLQLENLKTYGAVHRALDENRLELHGWVYDLANLQIRYYDVNAGHFVTFSPSTSQASA